MIVSIEEAQARLPDILARAKAGEEVVLEVKPGQLAVKLVPVTLNSSRLTQNPQLKRALTILDHEALVEPLPSGEWNGLAD